MRTLYAQVSQRLLSEVPRFFGSFEAALGELFQNASRSGASEVRVTYDRGAHALTLADNGSGLADPQILLIAGETGWNEKVIEPAGVGAFAILRDEYVTRVEYESYSAGASCAAWRMTLTPTVLRGEPATVEDLTPDGASSGLTVRLFLKPEMKISEELLRRARAFYPFKVLYADGSDSCELAPLRGWEPDLILNTPIGALEWSRTRKYLDKYLDEAVWEYRALPSPTLGAALRRAAQTHSELAWEIVNHGVVRWFIDPASGVRPRLPDRSELFDDDALARATQALVAALVERVLEAARQATQNWPARVSDLWSLPYGDADWLKSSYLIELVLPVLGWPKVKYTDLSQVSVYSTSYGDAEIDEQPVVFFDRTAREVASRALAFTLNILGHATSFNPNATNPRVIVDGLRESAQCAIALAERIEVEGSGALPYLIADEEGFDLPGLEGLKQGLIFAGSAAECIKFISESEELAHLAALRAWYGEDECLSDWLTWDSGEPELDYAQVRASLIRQVSAAFEPDLAAARDIAFKVRDACGPLEQALDEVHWAHVCLKNTGDAELKTLALQLTTCEKTLRATLAAVERRARQLAQRAGL